MKAANFLIFILGILGLMILTESCSKDPIPCTRICYNGGTCVVVNTNDTIFNCDCLDGFFGDSCQFENLCITQDLNCVNGGTCNDGTCACPPGFIGNRCQFSNAPVQDASGNSYPVVAVEAQLWMAENLRTIRCQGGGLIPEVTDNADWSNLTTIAYCNYDNTSNPTSSPSYGFLYNWHTVDTALMCNVCPVGWRLPTAGEWNILAENLGGKNVAGGNLKYDDRWIEPNEGAVNTVGWMALPGGFRHRDGTFYSIGEYGAWWSMSESENHGWYRSMNYLTADLVQASVDKGYGFSVRCIKKGN